VVVADGDAKALGSKRQPADARGGLELAHLALAVAHASLLAGRPCHGAVGPERDMIDPALLRVGRDRGARAVAARRHDRAVVAAGHEAITVAGRGEDCAAVRSDAP